MKPRLGLVGIANGATGLGLVCRDIVQNCGVDTMLAMRHRIPTEDWLGDRQMNIELAFPSVEMTRLWLQTHRPDIVL